MYAENERRYGETRLGTAPSEEISREYSDVPKSTNPSLAPALAPVKTVENVQSSFNGALLGWHGLSNVIPSFIRTAILVVLL
jgi:hypothetical protein